MIKKFISLYIMFSFCMVVFYACKCPEQPQHLGVSNLSFDWHRPGLIPPTDTVYTRDTLYFDFAVYSNCIATKTNNCSPFINGAFATSRQCPCGKAGFLQPITG